MCPPKGLKPGTSGSCPQFTAEPLPGASELSTSGNQLQVTVVPTKMLLGWHKCWLTLVYTEAPPESLQNQQMLAGFRLYQSTTQPASQTIYVNGGISWHHSPTEVTLGPWGQPPHNSSSAVVIASPQSLGVNSTPSFANIIEP